MNKLKFIDLFSGAGGLSEGFLKTCKYEGIAHVEWEKPMVDTLRYRLNKRWNHSEEEAKKRVIHFDIQKTEELIHGNWSDETKSIYASNNHIDIVENGINGILKGKVDVIIGGPPCQAYSIAGRAQDKNGMKDDYRNYLFESFVKVVDEYEPTVFVFENVPGMLSAKPGGILVPERIYKAFNEIGYEILNPSDIKKAVFTASDFGVPQKRRRVIVVGINKKHSRKRNIILSELYEAIESRKQYKIVTVKDAIGNLPTFKPLNEPIKVEGKNVSHVHNSEERVKYHNPRYHNKRDIDIFRDWVASGSNSLSSIDKVKFYNDKFGKNAQHAKYRNLEWEKPSPTIVAHLNKDGLMFIHPDKDQARSITVKEAAILQTFPDDYDFLGSQGANYKMIGNAVPVLLAENIAEAIYGYLKSK